MNALIIMLLFTWTKIMLVKKCQPATEIIIIIIIIYQDPTGCFQYTLFDTVFDFSSLIQGRSTQKMEEAFCLLQ